MTESMSPSEEFIAKRWFVIGAHQSGASDRTISNMVGLSPPSVHNIITQFKKSGTPIRKQLKATRKEPIKGFDKDGHLVDSDDDELGDDVSKKIKKKRPSVEDVIHYVLTKAQSNSNLNESDIKIKEEEEEERQTILLHQNKWRPPTPPYHPPNTFEQNSLPSPPLKEMKLDVSDWTTEEDKILMSHLLTRLSNERWSELVFKLKEKHDISSCKKRWELLRDLLLKGAKKSGTCGW